MNRPTLDRYAAKEISDEYMRRLDALEVSAPKWRQYCAKNTDTNWCETCRCSGQANMALYCAKDSYDSLIARNGWRSK